MKEKMAEMPTTKMTNNKNIRIEKCENGFVVRLDRETKMGYEEKKYIAKNQNEVKKILSKML